MEAIDWVIVAIVTPAALAAGFVLARQVWPRRRRPLSRGILELSGSEAFEVVPGARVSTGDRDFMVLRVEHAFDRVSGHRAIAEVVEVRRWR